MSFGPDPWHQRSWDARAAANFMAGGAGGGLVVCTAAAGGPRWGYALGAALVVIGLLSVAFEIGRPLRALNVLRNPRRSWMSREAIVAGVLLPLAVAAAAGLPLAGGVAALAGLAFVYCQGRMLRAAKGIPAWREPLVVPLIVASGLAEGAGIHLLLDAVTGSPGRSAAAWGPFVPFVLFVLALAARLGLWWAWRQRLRAPARALAPIDAAGTVFKATTLLSLAAALAAVLTPLSPGPAALLAAAAGVLAFAGGQWFKFTLVTRAAFNQGFAIPHLPVRGVRRG